MIYIGIPDKMLVPWLGKKKYIAPADEAEAVAIAAGYYCATKKRATVFMSADGFCNALNFLSSWIIPEGIQMNFVISHGRQEYQHKVISDMLQELTTNLPYEPSKIHFTLVSQS